MLHLSYFRVALMILLTLMFISKSSASFMDIIDPGNIVHPKHDDAIPTDPRSVIDALDHARKEAEEAAKKILDGAKTNISPSAVQPKSGPGGMVDDGSGNGEDRSARIAGKAVVGGVAGGIEANPITGPIIENDRGPPMFGPNDAYPEYRDGESEEDVRKREIQNSTEVPDADAAVMRLHGDGEARRRMH